MNEQADNTAEPASKVLSNSARPRFVVRRDSKLEPMNGATSRAEADERIEREITTGQVQEVDLYVYVGTFRPKRVVESSNEFQEQQ